MGARRTRDHEIDKGHAVTGYTVDMLRGLAIGGCAAILTIAGTTHAQEAPEPLSVAYEAPAGCPTSDAFFREIAARTTRARAATPNERARVMHVVVTKSGEQHVGRLWIEEANASSTARSVSGKTCSEVVSALALVGALAVDPRASTAPIAAAPIATEPASEAPPPPPPGKVAETSPPPPAPVVPPPVAPRTSSTSGDPPSASSPPGRIEVGVQVEAAFVAGAVPSGRLFGDVSIGPREGLFAPALRLAVARSLDVHRTAAIGGATLTWMSAGLDACPLRVVLARPVALRPCVGGSAGVLDASGNGFAGTVSRSRPWATLSALARLVWEPLPWLDLELEAGVIAPLFRESFFFAPSVSVYEAPAIAFLSRAGLGLRFP